MKIPKGQIEWLVNRLHVSVSEKEIEADIRRRANDWTEVQIRQAVEYAIACHHQNQDLYVKVRSGRI